VEQGPRERSEWGCDPGESTLAADAQRSNSQGERKEVALRAAKQHHNSQRKLERSLRESTRKFTAFSPVR